MCLGGPEFGNEGLNILGEGCHRDYILGLASVEHLGTLHPPGCLTVNQNVLYTRGVAVLALFYGIVISSGVNLLGSEVTSLAGKIQVLFNFGRTSFQANRDEGASCGALAVHF